MNKSKGFTIIELIVVIAIIAVLAAIVLVNVTQYINKGKAAAIQGNMATLMTNAAVYFDATPAGTGNTFTISTTGCGVADGTTATSAVGTAVTGAGESLKCLGDTTAGSTKWCAYVTAMPSGSTYATYCVDSTGYKGTGTAPGTTKCTGTTYTCL
jgi:prepilin-type N-terminal cleavage/methylation domain-containing protein